MSLQKKWIHSKTWVPQRRLALNHHNEVDSALLTQSYRTEDLQCRWQLLSPAATESLFDWNSPSILDSRALSHSSQLSYSYSILLQHLSLTRSRGNWPAQGRQIMFIVQEQKLTYISIFLCPRLVNARSICNHDKLKETVYYMCTFQSSWYLLLFKFPDTCYISKFLISSC